jgi:hypothetical protein
MAIVFKTRVRIRKARNSAILAIQDVKLRRYTGKWINVTVTD